ncbi:response regulator transcription factor [Chitinophaga rhizosphaerae]|uniref:response regulator transcription factor n=1 Tax=Chitinophaga rhizosphaerae TaxID=1864947 RepID=UPI000F7FE7F4|nr:response regulator transcription factor [Chitinophaga rhizosphaerae]
MPSIIIAEDHSVLRMGVKIIIGERYPAALIREADSFYQVLDLLREAPCDLLLLDIQLPGGGHPRMIAEVQGIRPATPILVFSNFDEETHAMSYLKAGAIGYLQKTAPPATVQEAISTVLGGSPWISAPMQTRLLGHFPKNNMPDSSQLSPREFEVMQMMVKGAGNPEIKAALNIQSSTLSTFKMKIFRKMGVNNVIELADKVSAFPARPETRS